MGLIFLGVLDSPLSSMTACASCRTITVTSSVAKTLAHKGGDPVPPGPIIFEITLNTSTSSVNTSIISPHHDRLQRLTTRAVPLVIWRSHLSSYNHLLAMIPWNCFTIIF